jgi:hypothetical protein
MDNYIAEAQDLEEDARVTPLLQKGVSPSSA